MTLSLHQYRRPLLALLAGLLSFAVAQDPGDACGGAADCGNLNFCQFATGACEVTKPTEAAGTCAMVPDMCPMDMNPVCGCDGRTYDNACKAHSNQVSVASEGDCGAAAVAVGIADIPCTAGDAAACDKGSFCQLATEGCGGAGTCAVVPEACIFLMDPVCGCDGENYSNECDAHAAGANVASKGDCDTPGAVGIAAADGSCTDDAACDKGDYCNFATGACGGAGKCDERPEMCTEEYAPVCGCDGEAHDNGCFARRAGASVVSAGACRSAGGEGAPEMAGGAPEMAGGAPETAEGAPETAEGADPEPAETTDTSDPDPDSMLSSGGTSAVQPSALGAGAALAFALGFLQ